MSERKLKLERDSYILMSIYVIQAIVALFLNTFLSAYIFNLTDNNIVPISWFNIYTFAVLSLFYLIGAKWMTHGHEMLVYRLSFVIDLILFSMIIYLKEQSVQYIWVLGLIWGIERGAYYFPQNLFSSVILKDGQVIKFNGYQTALSSFAKIVMPIFLGWFIDLNSFISASVFILALCIVKLILSMMLNYTSPRPKEKEFSFKVFSEFMFKRKKVRYALLIDFIRGFVTTAPDALIVLYVVYIFKTNLNLGIFTSVFALCTVVAHAVFGRYVKYNTLKPLLILCGLTTFFGAAYFSFIPSKFSFILFNFIFAIGGYLIRTMTNINFYRVSQNETEVGIYRAEYITIREIFLSIGKVLGCILLIGVAMYGNKELVKYLITLFSLFILVMSCMSADLSQKLTTDK